jgi:hypothetical protein
MSVNFTISATSVVDVPDASTVEAAAARFRSVPAALDSALASVAAAWARLGAPGVYETPESHAAHGALRRPRAIAASIDTAAAQAKQALEAYASALADLEHARSALLHDIGSATTAATSADASDPAAIAAAGTEASALSLRIEHFNARVEQADQDCADALRKVIHYDGEQIAELLHTLNEPAVSSSLGVSGSLLERYGEVKDLVGGTLQEHGIGVPGGAHAAAPSVQTPNGRQSMKFLAPGDEDLAVAGGRHVGVGSGIKLVEHGGAGLGVVGAVVTIGDTWTGRYDSVSRNHPTWSETRKRSDATEHAAFIGGGSVVYSAGGALVGAATGAAIGSAIPIIGTGIGALAGGIIGGFAMGAGMGRIGEQHGEMAMRWWDRTFKK